MKLLQKARDIDEGDKRIDYLTAYILINTGKPEEAAGFVEKAVQAAVPGDTKAINLKAKILGELGKRDKQIAALKKSLLIKPDQVKIMRRLAAALKKRAGPGDGKAALEYEKRASGNNENMGTATLRKQKDLLRRIRKSSYGCTTRSCGRAYSPARHSFSRSKRTYRTKSG